MDVMLGDTPFIVGLVSLSLRAIIGTWIACEAWRHIFCVQRRMARDGLRDPMRESPSRSACSALDVFRNLVSFFKLDSLIPVDLLLNSSRQNLAEELGVFLSPEGAFAAGDASFDSVMFVRSVASKNQHGGKSKDVVQNPHGLLHRNVPRGSESVSTHVVFRQPDLRMSEQLLHQRRFPAGSSERMFEIEVPSVFELKLSNPDTKIQHLDRLLHPVLSDLKRDHVCVLLAASLQA